MPGSATFTPASGATIGPGDQITADWTFGTFPVSTWLYVTTAYGEELAYNYNVAAPDVVGDGFELIELDITGGSITVTVKRLGGWNSPDSLLNIRYRTHDTTGSPNIEAFYATLDVTYVLDQPIVNHTEEGLSLLLEQFNPSPNLRAFLAAYLDQVQDLEDGIQPLLASKSIDIATGVSLDVLGAILNLPRAGLSDEAYRLRLRAEIAINNSDGTQFDMINVTQLLLAMTTKDIQYDEYFPKTVYLRPRNHQMVEDANVVLALLKRTGPAGTEVHFVYNTVEADDDDMYRFSDSADTTETLSTQGTENGELSRTVD